MPHDASCGSDRVSATLGFLTQARQQNVASLPTHGQCYATGSYDVVVKAFGLCRIAEARAVAGSTAKQAALQGSEFIIKI